MSHENEAPRLDGQQSRKSNGRAMGYLIAGALGICILAALFVILAMASSNMKLKKQNAELLEQQADLEQQISDLVRLQLEEQKLQVPIELTFREAVLGDGLVLMLRNTSGKHYTYAVTMRNKGVNQEKSGTLVISPGGTKEIGWAEGWAFTSGNEIEVKLDGFKTVTQRIP